MRGKSSKNEIRGLNVDTEKGKNGGTKSFFCFVFVFGRMQIRAAFMALQSKKFKEEIINFWKGCLFDMKIQNNIILVHRNDKILSYESWKTLVF